MTCVASAEGAPEGAKYTLFGVYIATINSLVLQAPRGLLFKGGVYSRAASDRADTVYP